MRHDYSVFRLSTGFDLAADIVWIKMVNIATARIRAAALTKIHMLKLVWYAKELSHQFAPYHANGVKMIVAIMIGRSDV